MRGLAGSSAQPNSTQARTQAKNVRKKPYVPNLLHICQEKNEARIKETKKAQKRSRKCRFKNILGKPGAAVLKDPKNIRARTEQVDYEITQNVSLVSL